MPALLPNDSIRATRQISLHESMTAKQVQTLQTAVEMFRLESSTCCPPYFLYSENKCFPLSSYNDVKDDENIIFGFFDPSTTSATSSEEMLPMGWPMRNLIAHLSIHFHLGGKTVSILSYRPKFLRAGAHDEDNSSLLLQVVVPRDYNPEKVVGWELNARGKPGPRWVNLRPLLDPHHLAVQAADLNLKLMKWRMIPSLNVEKLQSTKVLIIGAGTLGCSVAQILLGWGIRHVKFVDNGKVSYSNPVRQSLFTLNDCQNGGVPKATAAAEALKNIAADVHSEGIILSIPMPGHSTDVESMEGAVDELDKMVQECDVVFLLTDTRESRWLPTVMAAAHDKMLLNAALGLDSWLVMRHGGGLGCYFCNDVVAPENSMKNRTLDQQCTVTRPGLSPIASAMTVELMVALLHHPLAQRAPAPAVRRTEFSPTDNSGAGALGVMPHQIRGSLVSYTMMTPTVPAFPYCTGCAPTVVEAYTSDKTKLVQAVCESRDGSFLEDLSGLTAFRAEAAEKMVDMEDWEDDE
jgi:ubiquitin-like modifier-activating enzyme ATG7